MTRQYFQSSFSITPGSSFALALIAQLLVAGALAQPANAVVDRYRLTANIGDSNTHKVCKGPGNTAVLDPAACKNQDDFFSVVHNARTQVVSEWRLVITNSSKEDWKGFNLELTFFNNKNKMADVYSAECNGVNKVPVLTPQPNPYQINCPVAVKSGATITITFNVKVWDEERGTYHYILRVCESACGWQPVSFREATLSDSTSPNSGASGMNAVSVAATGVGDENVLPRNIVVKIGDGCHSQAVALTEAVSVAPGGDGGKLISFLLPSGLDPGQYYISISDFEEGDANFESSNCSVVNVVK